MSDSSLASLLRSNRYGRIGKKNRQQGLDDKVTV
nr:MAG TPA: hypothetical protein [Caudoviricetes sp.]